jgi:nucleoside-diphosphate-sugar epimerase
MGKRIVFTGGSDKAGKYAVAHLVERGNKVLNIGMKPLDQPGVHTLITDLTDGGQASNALTTRCRGGLYRHSRDFDAARHCDESNQRLEYLQRTVRSFSH